MPSSLYEQPLPHRFSNQNREHIISEKFQPKLWVYMAGIATNQGVHALAIGGMDDHTCATLASCDHEHCQRRPGTQGQLFALGQSRTSNPLRMAGRIFRL